MKNYARTSTGQQYHSLANYLFAPYQRNVTDLASNWLPQSNGQTREHFVAMYTFQDQGPPLIRQFTSVSEFSHAAAEAEDSSALLFLRGHQPAEMLNALGARYRVDPEFFRQHLELGSRTGASRNISSNSLPSTWANIIRVPCVTIASRSTSSAIPQLSNQSKLLKIRDETERLLDNHVEKFIQGRETNLPHGRSVVRRFFVHNLQHFSLEQEISLYVATQSKGWVGIVWLDAGTDLGQDATGPWQAKALQCESWEIQFHPTTQHRPGVALRKTHQPRTSTISETTEKEPNRLLQTAALLHQNYGQDLDKESMTNCPLYALTDIFTFVATSESMFFDIIQRSLDLELDFRLLSNHVPQSTDSLWNLVYNKRILDSHLSRIQGILTFLEHHASITTWPQAPSPNYASAALNKLRVDYTHLATRCQTLCAAFDNAMDIVQNSAMIDESQKAIAQAEGIAKLTQLAFFFIPVSLTASIFGMNMRQFTSDAILSVWVWVATSVVTLVFSYAVLNWGAWGVTERVMAGLAMARAKKEKRDRDKAEGRGFV